MFLRNIIDIKISNNEISVIRSAKISQAELEIQISKLEYSGELLEKHNDIENAQLPAFIQVFYYLFFKTLAIPSEQNFIDTYIEWLGGLKDNKINFHNYELDPTGIENRIKRTYPSLIRDLHFLYLLEASGKFEKVEYSMQMDYYNGLDIKVVFGGKEYFISLFIDTTRGRYFKRRKTIRHNYSEVTELIFNVDYSELTKMGSIYLLTTKHVERLIQHINGQ